MQIKSDITGKSLAVPFSDTATTLGSAILAGVGVGMYENFEDAVSQTVQITRRYEPDHTNDQVYEKNYETYLALYENLKGLMKHNAQNK